MPNKILVLMPRIYRGGAETQFRYFIKSYAQNGNSVIVAIENCYNDKDENVYIEEMQEYAQVFKLNWNYLNDMNISTSKIKKIEIMFTAYKDIAKILNSNHVDAVISYSRMSIMLCPLFRYRKVAYLFSERNTGERICNNRIYQCLLKSANYVFTNSDAAYRKYKSKGFKRLGVVHNGINQEEYKDKVYKDENNTPLKILIPGRICDVKNQIVVIEALKELKVGQVELSMAGKIENKDYMENIQKKCHKYGLNNVHYLGYISDMKRVYASYDLVILPSFEEGMPNVLLEALASRVMVFYSNIEMNIDVMRHPEYSFNPNCPEELITLIENWMITKKRLDIVDMLRKEVLEEYSFHRMSQGIAKYIEKSIEG